MVTLAEKLCSKSHEGNRRERDRERCFILFGGTLVEKYGANIKFV